MYRLLAVLAASIIMEVVPPKVELVGELAAELAVPAAIVLEILVIQVQPIVQRSSEQQRFSPSAVVVEAEAILLEVAIKVVTVASVVAEQLAVLEARELQTAQEALLAEAEAAVAGIKLVMAVLAIYLAVEAEDPRMAAMAPVATARLSSTGKPVIDNRIATCNGQAIIDNTNG